MIQLIPYRLPDSRTVPVRLDEGQKAPETVTYTLRDGRVVIAVRVR